MESLWLGSWLRFIAGNRLGPYVPTPHHVGARMLQLAGVAAADAVHDIGCGDGRLLLAAAQTHGASGVGYELDATLAKAAADAVAAAGLSHRIDIRREDARTACLAGADVVTMYLSEGGNLAMLPVLRAGAAKRSAQRAARGEPPRQASMSLRVCTFTFPIAGLVPVARTRVDGIDLFLYNITHHGD